MSSEPATTPTHDAQGGHGTVAMPRPTVAPMVLSLGIALLAAGVVTGPAFLAAGGVILISGLGLWISELLPGRGHVHEPLVEPSRRPAAVQGVPGTVERLQEGMPGYRSRLPERVHPISSGIKGGLVGALVMPAPAFLWGVFSGHGIWYPVNLLAGMLLPGVGHWSVAELEQFRPGLLALGVVIHLVMAVILGLIYGVLLPTLPKIPAPMAWGGLLMPLLWTGLSYGLMGAVNPTLKSGVDWPWFIVSQLVFGVAAAVVIIRDGGRRPVAAGLLGGLVGGLVMPVPALLWSVFSGHGIWYPANLLAALVIPGLEHLPAGELKTFHAGWLAAAIAIHAVTSATFSTLLGLLAPRLPSIPAPISWGGLLIPLLWTALSYALMGVVNPLLQHRVDWPWFIVSQFVFGVAAAVVVVRSETIRIPPAGRGPDRLAEFVAGQDEGPS